MTHTPRRSLFTALLVVGGLAATFVLARHWLLASPTSEPQPTPRAAAAALAVRLAPVQRGTVSATLELTGNFLPRRRTLVVAEVDGVIKRISYSSRRVEAEVEGRKYSEKLRLDLGQPVAQGEVLIELDPTEYELELAAAKARLEKTQKDLEDLLAWRRPEEIRRLKAMRAEAVARLERAEADLKRTEALIRQQATSPQLYDQALAELRAATAGVDRADADLAEAEAGPTAAQVAVARALVAQVEADVRIREDRLRKTVIRAPYDAVISERFVEEGERVTSQPRVELLEIIDLSLVLVQVGVPERYLGRVAIGGKVQVTAAGSVDPVPGLVFLMNEKVDHETRTFRVRVAVENHERRFKAGQFVKVAFEIASAPDSVTVPAAALVYAGGQPRVFVYDAANQQAVQRNVRLGLSGGGICEVVEGLSEGEQVVVHDPAVLADGMRVTPAASAPSPPPDSPPVRGTP